MQTLTWCGQEIPVPPIDLGDPELFHRNEFFRRAFSFVKFNEIRGDYAEFGCASARTFRMAFDHICMQALDMKLWAFDSFAGLPVQVDERDAHPKWTPGNYPNPVELFELIVARHGMVPSNYQVVPGFYYDTIGPKSSEAEALAPEIAIAYIDCDLHSSTADVLHFLEPRLKTGMIVAFDDYFCYSEATISGERNALLEFMNAHPRWTFVPFGQIGWHGQAFIVESSS